MKVKRLQIKRGQKWNSEKGEGAKGKGGKVGASEFFFIFFGGGGVMNLNQYSFLTETRDDCHLLSLLFSS